jgi:hypothetical protein
MLERMDRFSKLFSEEFEAELLSREEQLTEKRTARSTQKLDNGIEAQSRILAIPASKWLAVRELLAAKRLLTPKEVGILNIAMKIPTQIPSEKQCAVLLDVLEKARLEAIPVD